MRIIFFGTPDCVVPIVDKLHKTFKSKSGDAGVVAVVTQPPRPVGRKKTVSYSPVDDWTHKKGVEKFHSAKEFLASGIKADVGILAAYGEILPKDILDYFPNGILNVHPSLLPKFRGASPVQATILTREEAGASIIKLDEKMDHGPIVSQFKEEVEDDDTTETLRDRLFEKSAEALVALLPTYIEGKIKLKSQDHKLATYTNLVKKADAFIQPKILRHTLKGRTLQGQWKIPFIKNYSLSATPHSLERFVRAMQPWPISWTTVQLDSKLKTQNLRRLKILKTHVEKRNNKAANKPTNVLILDQVQLEGKNPVSWRQFTQAYPDFKFSK